MRTRDSGRSGRGDWERGRGSGERGRGAGSRGIGRYGVAAHRGSEGRALPELGLRGRWAGGWLGQKEMGDGLEAQEKRCGMGWAGGPRGLEAAGFFKTAAVLLKNRKQQQKEKKGGAGKELGQEDKIPGLTKMSGI